MSQQGTFESNCPRCHSTARAMLKDDCVLDVHGWHDTVILQCNECGKKRKVSTDGNFNDRCPKCGGVDWEVQ
jgi:phage FluMu protein Com